MDIAISGGTGFIGKYLVKELINGNHLNILTRDTIKAASQLPYEGIHLLDLSAPQFELKEKLKNTEVLIHLAAYRPQKVSDQKFESWFNNLKITDKILNLLPQEKNIRVINISSKSVYGPNNIVPYNETQLPKPHTFYGLSKLTAEQIIDVYCLKSNFNVIHLRIGQVIGWGDSQKNIITTFLDNALNKRTQEVWGNGIGSRSYIYAKDVVNAIKSVIKRKETGIFNIAWQNVISHLELAKCINKVFKNDKIEFLVDKPSDSSIEKIDTTKAREILNWFPQYANLEEALLDMKKEYDGKKLSALKNNL